MGIKDLRQRMILASTPRAWARWYALCMLAQGWTAAATAEALERDPLPGCKIRLIQLTKSRVELVPQPVSKQVHGHHREQNRQTWHRGNPPGHR